jgi:transcriptional regulator with XRE-family HTH domain
MVGRGGLGSLLVERRRELGLTQQVLAQRIGVPAANLSVLERSTSRWHARLFWALAQALRVPQLELALAAGVITDLPPLSSSRTSAPDQNDHVIGERGSTRLERLVEELEPNDADFLAAIAQHLLERRRLPSPAREAALAVLKDG